MDMNDEEFNANAENLRKRKAELMAPLEMQIMMCDDKNEVLILAAAMAERAYSIFKEHYGRSSAVKLISTMIEIVDEKDGDYYD
jgi:hypothetical protein